MTASGVAQIQQLIAKWRRAARDYRSRQYNALTWQAIALEVERCADELEAALLAVDAPQVEICPHCGRPRTDHDSACEFERFTALAAVDAPPPQAEEPWQDISTYSGHAYELLFSPAHSRVIGAHVTGDVWHLVGVGCVTNRSERPTHWMPLPQPPTARPTRQEGS